MADVVLPFGYHTDVSSNVTPPSALTAVVDTRFLTVSTAPDGGPRLTAVGAVTDTTVTFKATGRPDLQKLVTVQPQQPIIVSFSNPAP